MLFFGISEQKIDRWKSEKNVKNLSKGLTSKKENIRKAAAKAFLEIGDSAILTNLEVGLNDPLKEIQLLIAEGYQSQSYRPVDEKNQIIMDFILQDKNALLEHGAKADAYLKQMLEKLATGDAAFAAEILEARKWEPKTDQEKSLYLLALQKFDELGAIGEKAIPQLNNYYSAQEDVQLRRKAVLAMMELDDFNLSPYLKKYADDSDEEIANLAKVRIKEIQKTEIVKQNKTKWGAFFRSPSLNSSESDATKFISLGMDYLENDLLFEAYCAFGIADYIYEKLTGGYVIKNGLTISDLTTQRDREIKVFGDFRLESVLEQISESIRGKREQSDLISMLLGNQPDSDLNAERMTFQQILQSTQVHDKELLDAFVEFIISKDKDSNRAWRAIIHLPDKRLTPSLIDAFQYGEFVFDPVQALIYIGDEALPELLECLKNNDRKYRTNAAFALGMIVNKDAIKPLKTALKKEKDKVTQAALHFALDRLGDENGHVDAMIDFLEDDDPDVRHTAARCLRHLNTAIDLKTVVKYLEDDDDIVRLYCVGIFSDAKDELPEDLLKSFVDRIMKEKDDGVMEKLVSGISKRKDDKMLPELLLKKLNKANDTQKDKIITILGNLGAKESADTLMKLLPKAKTEFRRSLLWTLGQLGATGALKEMKNVLRYNEQLQRTAAFAILFLSDTDKDAARKALSGVDNMDAKMARAILGEKDAIQSIKSGLSSYNTIQDIFGALDAANMVKDESFKSKLYDLLEYSDVNYYPTDRYVRHTAIGVLVRILL